MDSVIHKDPRVYDPNIEVNRWNRDLEGNDWTLDGHIANQRRPEKVWLFN